MSDPLGAEHPTPPVGLVARWVAASSLGELPGLGGVGLLAAGLVPAIQFLSVSVVTPLATAAADALGWALGMPLVFLGNPEPRPPRV